jgi:hypothetical protein
MNYLESRDYRRQAEDEEERQACVEAHDKIDRMTHDLKDWIAQLKEDDARSGSVYMIETTSDVIRRLRRMIHDIEE